MAADVSGGLSSSSLGSGCSSSFVGGDVVVWCGDAAILCPVNIPSAVCSTACFGFIRPMNCSTESRYGICIPVNLANLRPEKINRVLNIVWLSSGFQ